MPAPVNGRDADRFAAHFWCSTGSSSAFVGRRVLMSRALWVGALILAGGSIVSAQVHEPKTAEARAADVRKLFEVTGAARMGLQMRTSLGETLRKAHPEVPDAVWSELLAEFRSEELAELAVPIYMKYLTAEEIEGLLTFYESPLGRKLLEVQPQILQESVVVGRQWGEDCARRVMKRLREKGYGSKATDVEARRRTRG
jgi:hypothetical protein